MCVFHYLRADELAYSMLADCLLPVGPPCSRFVSKRVWNCTQPIHCQHGLGNECAIARSFVKDTAVSPSEKN